MPFYERQPFIQPLYQIVTEVMNGDIRVPRFQRPGSLSTWTPEQRGDLLDSLYRGYPVGTVLLWSTVKPIQTLEWVGGRHIPALVEGGSIPLRLLLDGHQRLSTLVQILGSGLSAEPDGTSTHDAETWVFELNPSNVFNSRERFQLLRSGQLPTTSQVPLSIVLNRAKLNQWIRDFDDITDAQIREVDDLRDRLREYSVPVAVLVADSLDEATVSFKRINSSGTPMSDYNMVTALAYRDDFDPQVLFEDERAESLEPVGWRAVDDSDILRVCAGLVGHNPARIEVDILASRLRENESIIKQACVAMRAATEVLRHCGIHGPEALPYSWQLITIAILIGEQKLDIADDKVREAIVKWVWLTTYGEVFAGGTKTSIYSRTSNALREMVLGNDWRAMERDVTRNVRQVERFDYRAARSRACALAMARLQDNNDVSGPAHKALAQGVSSMQLLILRGGQRATWWHLAVISSNDKISELREALKRREQQTVDMYDGELLEKLGVNGSQSGTVLELLEARRDLLIGKEKEFVAQLGLQWID